MWMNDVTHHKLEPLLGLQTAWLRGKPLRRHEVPAPGERSVCGRCYSMQCMRRCTARISPGLRPTLEAAHAYRAVRQRGGDITEAGVSSRATSYAGMESEAEDPACRSGSLSGLIRTRGVGMSCPYLARRCTSQANSSNRSCEKLPAYHLELAMLEAAHT